MLESGLKGLTDDELAKLRERAKDLVGDPQSHAGLICAVMITSRRLYTVASGALKESLIDEEGCDLLEEYITSAARQSSETDFTSTELFNAISGAVLPWLLQEIIAVTLDQRVAIEEEDKPKIHIGDD
jgi:DNA-binding protein YbaB